MGSSPYKNSPKYLFYRPCQQKTHLCLLTKVRFLNDVCQSSQCELYGKMMLATPVMTASPNDAWLRHILWQTSHHCETKWSNIILSEAKNIISPQAMHHWYEQALSTFEINQKILEFDEVFPQYSWFSQTKKLDFLLWQMRD